jgi:hypothetical protein
MRFLTIHGNKHFIITLPLLSTVSSPYPASASETILSSDPAADADLASADLRTELGLMVPLPQLLI